jgi:hypothetical protein
MYICAVEQKSHANINCMQNSNDISIPKAHALSNGGLVFAVSLILCAGKYIRTGTGYSAYVRICTCTLCMNVCTSQKEQKASKDSVEKCMT